ncbi:MAG: tRNA-intron lyase [Acidilobaceae archaeon]|nr:tRNA-intron lyase [Acidilobaceae archaeon]MCX8165961.1 tRNA-intron lyase [Acidilobaceae archaeon]MDW7974604.1 tRNA-intron lyase [Sulfolobales archaeon]
MKVRGYLVEGFVLVVDLDSSVKLYSSAFFGTPLGVEKPKGGERVPLRLSLPEALYLAERGELEVLDEKGEEVSLERLRELVNSTRRGAAVYAVYKDLRSSGLVVRSGLKFGADFIVYRLGPGLEHAPYIVHVSEEGERVDPADIVRASRVGHSVRKSFVMAFPRRGRTEYLVLKWVRL